MNYSGINAKAQRKYSNSGDFQHVTKKIMKAQMPLGMAITHLHTILRSASQKPLRSPGATTLCSH